MKVIKQNYFPNIFPMQIKCEKVVDSYGFSYGEEKDFCGSELEVSAEDIRKHNWFKYPNYEGTDYIVICPVCGQFIAINRDIIPNHIKDNAIEIRKSDRKDN